MDIQCKVEDASDLKSGGGTAGAENRRENLLTIKITHYMYINIDNIYNQLSSDKNV